MKIRVPCLIWMNLAIVSVGALFISGLNLSNFLYYIADGFNIILLWFAIKHSPRLRRIKYMRPLKIMCVLFLLVNVIGIIGNQVPAFLALWGIRNVWRYIIFYTACIVLLTENDIKSFFKILPTVFWINFIVAVFQYTRLGLRNDSLGGIFGVINGCNGALTIFLNIVIAYVISQYLHKERTLLKTIPYVVVYFLLAVMSETKGNFVFFIIVVIAGILAGKKSRRTLMISISSVFGLIIGINILAALLPNSANVLLNFDNANAYMNASYFGYTTFTRNATLTVANEYFFQGNSWLYLFGYGIGACDMSSFFASPFYLQYGDMNYRYFGSAMMVLQTGYLGLGLFLTFFVITAFIAFKMASTKIPEQSTYYLTTVGVACFCIIFTFYASAFVDMGYWVWFVMAIPLIILKSNSGIIDSEYEGIVANIERNKE